jgi:hypothetical protein
VPGRNERRNVVGFGTMKEGVQKVEGEDSESDKNMQICWIIETVS